MAIIDDHRAIIQPLSRFWYGNKVASMDMLRLDLLHPVISGNKWFKLRLNLMYAQDHGRRTIVTFGGAYSNHLVATAFAAEAYGLQSVGIVRGEQDQLTPTLQQCKEYGMELIFVTRSDYANKHQPGWAEEMVAHFDEIYIIPEGGANERGRAGAGLISRYVGKQYTHVVLSAGTGTTLAGLRTKLSKDQLVLGFVPMKENHEQQRYIDAHLTDGMKDSYSLYNDSSFGGFGKWNSQLLHFMNEFYEEHEIPLDIIYTSKMMYYVKLMLEANHFSTCDKVLCIHTGGLQGNVSVADELIY